MKSKHKLYQESLAQAALGEKDQVQLRSKPKAQTVAKPKSQPIKKIKISAPVQKRSLFPNILISIICVASVAGLSWALINVDKIDRYLGKIQIGLFGQAQAEAEAEKTNQTKGEEVGKNKPAEGPRQPASVPKADGITQEEMNYFTKLSERKRELDAREAVLKKLEDELHIQKGEIEKGLAELEKMRSQISTMLKDKVEVDEQRVDMLVQFYSTMKPQNAAQVFESINDDLAVEVLLKMKKKNAADILNLLKADKAKMLSERMAGYKRK